MPTLVSYREIVTQVLPPVDWLVRGLIVNGDRALVYGEPGALKSWLLLDLGLHIAAGLPWLGQFSITAVKKVLYVDEEMSERTLTRRIRRLASGAMLGTAELPFMSISGTNFRFEGERVLLRELGAQAFDPDVVIVETLRSVLVGDENNAQDVRNFWRSVEPFRQHNKTIIVSHHMRKPQQGQNNARYRASGSTDLIGGPDTALAVERAGNQCVARITHIKCRNAEEHEPFSIRLQDQGQGEDCPVILSLYDGISAGSVALRANEQLANKIIEYLASLAERSATTRNIKQEFKRQQVTADRIDKALRCLRGNQRVAQPFRGVWALRETTQEGAEANGQTSAESPSPIGMAVAATSLVAADADHRVGETRNCNGMV